MRERESRYKLVSVWCADIVNLVCGRRDGVMGIPYIEGVPEDAIVDGVHFEWQGSHMVFRIWHESYPIVGDGEMIPMLYDGVVCPIHLIPVEKLGEVYDKDGKRIARLDENIPFYAVGKRE